MLTEQERLPAKIGPMDDLLGRQGMSCQQRQQDALAPERHSPSSNQGQMSRNDCDIDRAAVECTDQAHPRTFLEADIYMRESPLIINQRAAQIPGREGCLKADR